MATTTSVLRIGPSDASSELLKQALLSYFDSKDPNTLTVSNRYFSAKVQLKDLPASDTNSNEEKEDGVILVFDALQSNPDNITETSNNTLFDSLAHVHSHAEKADTCGDLLRLCVGVHVGEATPSQLRGNAHEEEFSKRVLWCLDHGYEYLEVDLSKDAQKSGHDERDKEGFARLVEAISGTVWSSAIMEKKKQQELKQSYQQEKEQLQQQDDEKEQENPYVPPDPSLLDSEIQASLVNNDTDTQPQEHDYFTNDDGGEEERAMENLEGLLREATRIREASRAGEMTDDERRKRAADAATLMMNLMNQLDVEEDQEDDFEVDSSSDEEETTTS